MARTISSIYANGPNPYARQRRDQRVREQSARAWHERGIAMIPVEDLLDDLEQQMITNIANRLYGRRRDAR